MKTKFVKAAVWMLVVALLAVAVSFTVTAADVPSDVFADNWSLSASAQTVVPGQDVTIYLVADKSLFCDGIAGSWDLEDTTHNVQLVRDTNNTGLVINPAVIVDSEDPNKKTPNYAYPITGEFMWVNSIDSTQGKGSFAAGDWIVKAVYTVATGVPDGEYVINFTKTVYAGLGQVDESEETLSITIKVQHVCEASETLGYDKFYHWQVCAQCNEMIGSKASHQYTSFGSDENYHWNVCACGATTTKFPHTSAEYEVDETGHIGVCSCGIKSAKQTHYVSEYGAKNEHEHTGICICKYELTEEHTYDQEGLCACGAVKHICAGNLTAHAAVAPTCKTEGNSAYWSCTCGSFYSDAAATSPIAEDSWILAVDPDNHESTEVTYTDNGETHSATYNCCGGAYVTNEGHDYDQAEGTECVCGAVKPVTNVTVVAKGTINHTVEGQIVTVTHTAACKVGYWNETEGKYVAIPAVANGSSYNFTAPAGVTEVLLVVKGDISGDGRVNAKDRSMITKSMLSTSNSNYAALTDACQVFAADVSSDGRVNAKDKSMIYKCMLSTSNPNYATLAW